MTAGLGGRYRTALVTGASSGLGRAFAEMLAREGVRVWGSSRSAARLAPLAAAHPGMIEAVALELGDAKGAVAAFDAASKAAGGFDLVVNNAGFGVFGQFAETEASVWTEQIGSMLGTVTAISHAAYRSMKGRGKGCLVHVSSIAAEFPIPYMSGYNVAKAGLSALSESLMFESRGSAVTVIDFRPGDYRTDFNKAMTNPSKSERASKAWVALDRMFAAAPLPEAAALDLRRALFSGRSGIVRSGTFFQARVAQVLARLAPASLVRGAISLYYGL